MLVKIYTVYTCREILLGVILGIFIISLLLMNISTEHVLLPWLLRHNPPQTPEVFQHTVMEGS